MESKQRSANGATSHHRASGVPSSSPSVPQPLSSTPPADAALVTDGEHDVVFEMKRGAAKEFWKVYVRSVCTIVSGSTNDASSSSKEEKVFVSERDAARFAEQRAKQRLSSWFGNNAAAIIDDAYEKEPRAVSPSSSAGPAWFTDKDASRDVTAVLNDIGLSDEEKQVEQQRIGQQIKNVYSLWYEVVNEKQKRLTHEVATMRRQVEDTYTALQRPYDGALRLHGLSLKSQIRELELQATNIARIKSERWQAVRTKLELLHQLWRQLGVGIKAGFEMPADDGTIKPELLTDKTLSAIDGNIAQAKIEVDKRVEGVSGRAREISQLIHEMGLKENEYTPLDRAILSSADGKDLSVTVQSLHEMDERYNHLLKYAKDRLGKLHQLTVRLKSLWARLEIGEDVQQSFLSHHSGIGPEVIEDYENEVSKLTRETSARLGDMFSAKRQELFELWEETMTGEEERRKFAPAHTDRPSEDLLELLENEIDRQREKLKMCNPIIKLILERENIRKEQMAYKAMAQDPKRFKIPGYFAKEEKFRGMVKKSMPKLNAQLAPLLESYEIKWGPFLYDDVPYTIIDDDEVAVASSSARKARSATQPVRTSSTKKIPTTPRESKVSSVATTPTAAAKRAPIKRATSTFR